MSQAWLTLSDAAGLTGNTLEPLLDRFGGAEALASARPADLRAAGVPDDTARDIAAPDPAHVEAGLAWLAAATDHHLITWSDPRYPSLLKQISDRTSNRLDNGANRAKELAREADALHKAGKHAESVAKAEEAAAAAGITLTKK